MIAIVIFYTVTRAYVAIKQLIVCMRGFFQSKCNFKTMTNTVALLIQQLYMSAIYNELNKKEINIAYSK